MRERRKRTKWFLVGAIVVLLLLLGVFLHPFSASILRMAALVARFPKLILVPAHDARGFAEIPPLQ